MALDKRRVAWENVLNAPRAATMVVIRQEASVDFVSCPQTLCSRRQWQSFVKEHAVNFIHRSALIPGLNFLTSLHCCVHLVEAH